MAFGIWYFWHLLHLTLLAIRNFGVGQFWHLVFLAFGTLAAAMAVVEAALGRSRVAIYAWPLMVDYMTSSCMSDAATGAGSCGRIPIHLHSAREITRFPMSVSLPRMDKKDLKYCCNMLNVAVQQNLTKSTSST